MESKSYILVSQLAADICSKYIDDKETSHLTGFTFVVIGIIHLAGGKISEGKVSPFCFLFLDPNVL